MAHTIDDFLNYFPEFSDIQDKTFIDRFLLEAELMVDLDKCPKIGELIRYYYTAHALTKSSVAPDGMDDSMGVVTSASVGSVSESREVGTKKTRSYTDNWYNSTHYGARFLQLRAKCFGGGLVAP